MGTKEIEFEFERSTNDAHRLQKMFTNSGRYSKVKW